MLSLRITICLGLFGFILAARAGAAPSGAPPAGTNVYLLDCTRKYQVVDNFGANDAWSIQKIGGWSEPAKSRIADLLFSTNTGAGLSCWRFYVGAGLNHQTIQNDWCSSESFATAEGKYDWTRQAGERWFLRAAKARGVRQFVATVYSPPPWLTRNGLSNLGADTNSTTNLQPDAEDRFAHYIADILTHFRDNPDERERIEFDYVVPVNEPQWGWQQGQEGNRASNDDLQRIYAALARQLKLAGLKTKILGPESGSIPDMYSVDAGDRDKWHVDYGDYLHLLCTNSEWFDRLGGVVSYHSYWSDRIPDQLGPDRERLGRAMAQFPGWKIWQSEYCIMESGRSLAMDTALRVARVIDCDLTLVNASAWQWWLAVANENYKSGLIYTDYKKPGDAETVWDAKTLWALGNYSRFIRPGMVRVAIRQGQPPDMNGLLASAFVNPQDNRVVIVFVNLSEAGQRVAIHLSPAGKAAGGPVLFTPYVTSATDNLRRKPSQYGADGLELAPRSVTTLVSEPAP